MVRRISAKAIEEGTNILSAGFPRDSNTTKLCETETMPHTCVFIAHDVTELIEAKRGIVMISLLLRHF